ncbi:MAG: 2-oxoglutarate ferredoxin oxidoreductase subunit alpha, partial [Spirochaetia bacterium]|nr:2-oxoglutarate ferredoxin oxidoreductase subunit alpha [Spirochaetia bacterium]
MVELPLVIVNVQRAGPSTGMPTKTEQSDLLQVMFGRNGESPIPVVSADTPADCFQAAIDATRIALEFMTPVFVLTDGYIANGSEPWRLPKVSELPKIANHKPTGKDNPAEYKVYKRDEKTLARLWASPGLAGFEHRIGGIEKDFLTGNVSYDPENHQKMTDIRAKKVADIANFIPDQDVFGDQDGDVLVIGWGSTHGAIRTAVEEAREEGKRVSHAHIRFLNPFPKNLDALLQRFKHVLVPELNLGQLAFLLQGKFARPVKSLTKVKGRPFLVREIKAKIDELVK